MHISGFDLNLLLVLHALFEEGGVEAAAARIHLSRSAFSHALARAREALGEPIAVKVGRRLELPPRGQALREPVRQALTAAERAFLPPQRFKPCSVERVFHLAATDYTLSLLWPRLMSVLSREAPGFRLRTQVLGPGGCRAGGERQARRGPGHLPLGPERHRGGDAVRGRLCDTRLEELGHTREVALRTSSFLMVPMIVSTSELVADVSVRLAAEFTARYRCRALPLPFSLTPFAVTLLWHRRVSAAPAHRWLRDAVVEAAQALGPVPVRVGE